MDGKVLCVDFDHTLCNSPRNSYGQKMGPPMPGAHEALNHLIECGYTIIIFTAREPERHHIVEGWCREWKIPFHRITNIKPQEASLFIDDRALEFKGTWDGMHNRIAERFTEREEMLRRLDTAPTSSCLTCGKEWRVPGESSND